MNVLPNQEELNKVLSISVSKCRDFFETLKYIRKCRDDKELKDACSYLDKNTIKNINLWKRILSFVAKDFFIARELHKVRNNIFGMMFNTFKPDFTESEIKAIIENVGNYWLGMDHSKIRILKDFCDSFLQNAILCENLCKLKGDNEQIILLARDEYHAKRTLLLDMLENIASEALEEYKQKELLRLQLETKKMGKLYITPDDGNNRLIQYNDALEDTSLLQE